MFDSASNLRWTVLGVRAPEIDVALFRGGERRAALRAAGRHDPFALSPVPQFDDGTENLGDHVTGLAQNHRVTQQHALLDDDVFVVEGRLTNNRTSDGDRLHHRVGRGAARSTDSDDDVEQNRVHLLGRVLVGDGPARCPRCRPEPIVKFEAVDLDDNAVDLVFEVVAVLTVSLDVRDRPDGIGHD